MTRGVTLQSLDAFFDQNADVVEIDLTRVRGSSPRDAGTQMFVSKTQLWGTIGGGQLEYLAIQTAREMLEEGPSQRDLQVPLGPEIGQCCGGNVEIRLTRMRNDETAAARARAGKQEAAQPEVYIFGAGHVGRALAKLFQHMPVKTQLIDSRAEEMALNRAEVVCHVSAMPEVHISHAAPGSAFIVLTHDHGLDFLLSSAALQRGDAAYVGMIGSSTKRAKFNSWMRDHCEGVTQDALTCPIGARESRDKRPSVIAAFVAAEVMDVLTSEPSMERDEHRLDLNDVPFKQTHGAV